MDVDLDLLNLDVDPDSLNLNVDQDPGFLLNLDLDQAVAEFVSNPDLNGKKTRKTYVKMV
jgi:hypothetical protein